MKSLFTLLVLASASLATDTKLYELRVYWAAEGKLDALHARFRDHTVKLFEKHGIENVGYWVPLDTGDHRLIYLVAHKDQAAADASWKAFGGDADWKKAMTESEKNGKLVSKLERFYLNAADFSPAIAAKDGKAERVFELRTYVTGQKDLLPLLERFRNHTVKLFEKHGMTNLGYWTLASDKVTNGKLMPAVTAKGDDKVDAKADAAAKETTLVYLLSHATDDARKKSFDAFRADPVWVTVKSASEAKAGGPLTVKDGVKSLSLKATDYSPWK